MSPSGESAQFFVPAEFVRPHADEFGHRAAVSDPRGARRWRARPDETAPEFPT